MSGVPRSDRTGRASVTCRLQVTLPESSWLRLVTVTRPDVRIEVLDRLPLPHRLLMTEARVHGGLRASWARSIRRCPGVQQVQFFEEPEGTTIFRVTARAPQYLRLFQQLRVLRRYPFWVEKGVASWVITGSRAQVHRLIAGLHSLLHGVVVEEVRLGLPSQDPLGLTSRQRELVRAAFTHGYFDVPRGISLTKLALQFGISKGSLSKTLALAEGRMLSASHLALLKSGS